MVWPAVCENIRRRFLDAIQKPIPGEATWSMDVFFFLALDDPPDGKIDQWRVQRDVNAAQLEYCKELLRPVHTEFMPPTYPMPKHHNCTPGHEPSYAVQTALWNVPGASERMYAQCYRQQIAYDYVLNTHEPQHGVRYDALIRARPDSIYLQDVPPISHFNLSRITTASTAPGDHWHIVHRGCSGPKRRYCLRCQGSEYDEHCRNETVNVDVAVQAVVAREKPLSFARKMKLEKAKVPERSGKSKADNRRRREPILRESENWRRVLDYGMLVLECDRQTVRSDGFRGSGTVLALQLAEPSACSSLQGAFLGAPPPVTPVSRRVVAVAPENSAKPEGAPAVAVLIIGAARAMVWPEVCENIQENLVKGLASLGPDGQHWRVDVLLGSSETGGGVGASFQPSFDLECRSHFTRFFFLALEESIQARDKTMIRHSFEEELLKPCQDLMKPVHVDWMPPSYPMPGASNCKAGQEPWYVYPFYKPGAEPEKVLGADERMYSQCKRIQIAYDYVTQEFEPKVGLQYQAFLRARPDGVYLHPVPPMGSFALSQLTISATAPGDHWHLIHRGCLGPFERRCLRCRGKEYDKRCPKPKKVLDLGVQEVIARERSADVVCP
ncbi:unnamed protein product [Durusdinium trenchii]|uniref:Uncharacterized protein n=1 Tax=Durusdinium trenchii TaxID=1381693 RepID=A0ABP0LTA0_9DINO